MKGIARSLLGHSRAGVLVLLALVGAAVVVLVVQAEPVPRTFTYQAVLTDDTGNPISGSHAVRVSLYDGEFSAVPLCAEDHAGIDVRTGLFRVIVGDGTCTVDPAWFTQSEPVWIGLTVDTDSEMTPRAPLFPVASAYQAEHAERAESAATVDAAPGGAPVGTVAPWLKSLTGVPSTLPDGWLECNGQVVADAASPLNGQTVPDLNGGNRFLRGSNASGGTGGEETHVLSQSEMPSHTHPSGVYRSSGGSTFPYVSMSATAATPITTGSAGSGTAHENRPPFYNVVWIIRVK